MESEDALVKVCQQEIVKLDMQLKAAIQDIRNCDGPVETLQALNHTVRGRIHELKGRIEELEKLAREQDKETAKVALLKDADNHRKQLVSTQTTLRQANVACHLAIERKEKGLLMSGGTELRQRSQSNKKALAKTSNQITENLMSLSRMMSSQVTHGESTLSTLVSSSKQVTDTNEEFKTMTGHIQNSRKLLTKYSRREFTDKLLIFLALVFFFATVLYIIKKRLFYSNDNVTNTGTV